jgi:glycosyltransferase involved in cell wall biosynthesis
MDIGIVTPRYPPNVAGGGEISAELLATHLQTDDRIEQVTVLSFDGARTENRNGITVQRIKDISPILTEWQNAWAYRPLRRLAGQFDILHGYNMEIYPALGAATLNREVATVATLNSYHFFRKQSYYPTPETTSEVPLLERVYEYIGNPTTGRVLRYYIQNINKFIPISESVKEIHAGHGFNPKKMEVIPNMLDSSFSVPHVEPTEGILLLYVGTISKEKGVDVLVRAVQYLPEDFHLRVVGDGPMLDDVQTVANSLDLIDQISFTGYVDYSDIPEEYARADIFVHPGVWPEPFGRTILEAMQAGLPVVCTDIGGPSDIVRNPELRCPPGDAGALAECIKSAASMGRSIGKENYRYIHETFAPEVVISKIVDLYECLISSHR